MLSRKQLEEIIKAWPDENGVSSDPQVYDQWILVKTNISWTKSILLWVMIGSIAYQKNSKSAQQCFVQIESFKISV